MAGAATRRAAPPMLLLLLTLAALAPAHGGRTTGPRGSLLGSPHGVDERAEQAACANGVLIESVCKQRTQLQRAQAA